MAPYWRWRWSAEVRSGERRRWWSVTREQSLGEGSPAAECGYGVSGSGGERARGRGALGVLSAGEKESE
jgi:hypothetical protein